MSKTKTSKRCFRVQQENLGDVCAYAKELLDRPDVNDETAKETVLTFEALMQKLMDWGLDENTDLEISGTHRLGEYRIKVAFEGKVFSRDEGTAFSIEDRILDAHDDKLDYSYHSGRNEISISVRRSSRKVLFACVIASLCAIIAYIPLRSLLDEQMRLTILYDYILPIETMYTNAALMVGAPMTFFSLLKNLTDTYVVSQRSSGIRQLQARTIATSALAILLAFVSFLIMMLFLFIHQDYSVALGSPSDWSFAEIVRSLIPPSIFEPFESILPVPLIVVALLVTYAMCSAGKYFNSLRYAMMTCYTLFSRMLHVVIAVLPLFCFVAVMDALVDSGFTGIFTLFFFLAVIYLGSLLLLLSYAIRLRAHGVKVIPFFRKLVPLLRENFRIGSVIDAAPYNIRYCTRVFKMSREMLERNIPVIAEINLDGNCFILMLFTLVFFFITSTTLPWLSIIVLALLILFLSLGAPNQPGSILIGVMIILMYMNSSEMLCAAIFAEAFLGSAQNLINVLGDMVMVAIEDSKERRSLE